MPSLDNSAPHPDTDLELSTREAEVLSLFAEGKSAHDTAAALGISKATVMFHYRRVAERWGTLNRTHTVVEAIKKGAMPLLRQRP